MLFDHPSPDCVMVAVNRSFGPPHHPRTLDIHSGMLKKYVPCAVAALLSTSRLTRAVGTPTISASVPGTTSECARSVGLSDTYRDVAICSPDQGLMLCRLNSVRIRPPTGGRAIVGGRMYRSYVGRLWVYNRSEETASSDQGQRDITRGESIAECSVSSLRVNLPPTLTNTLSRFEALSR